MNEPLELYIKQLDEKLMQSVSATRRAELIAEIRTHLEMSAKDVPTEEALQRFGTAAQVADDLVYQERGYRSKPAWRLAAVPAVLYFASFCLLPLLLMATGLMWYLHSYVWIWIYVPLLVLITFTVSAYRSRRWILGPMVAVVAISFVLTVAIQTIPSYRHQVDRQITYPASVVAELKGQRTEAIHDLELANLGYSGFQSDPSRFRVGNQYKAPTVTFVQSVGPAPFLPFNIRRPAEPVPTMGKYATKQEAALQWQEAGAALAASLKRVLAANGHPTFFQRTPFQLWNFVALPMVERLVVLALVNALILAWFAKRKRNGAPKRATAR